MKKGIKVTRKNLDRIVVHLTEIFAKSKKIRSRMFFTRRIAVADKLYRGAMDDDHKCDDNFKMLYSAVTEHRFSKFHLRSGPIGKEIDEGIGRRFWEVSTLCKFENREKFDFLVLKEGDRILFRHKQVLLETEVLDLKIKCIKVFDCV